MGNSFLAMFRSSFFRAAIHGSIRIRTITLSESELESESSHYQNHQPLRSQNSSLTIFYYWATNRHKFSTTNNSTPHRFWIFRCCTNESRIGSQGRILAARVAEGRIVCSTTRQHFLSEILLLSSIHRTKQWSFLLCIPFGPWWSIRPCNRYVHDILRVQWLL